MIDVNFASPNSFVFDTGCGSHLCNHLQGLREVRPLEKGEIELRVGNGTRIAAVSVGTYVLSLPSGLELYLYNCYFVPCLSTNIISVSILDNAGFEFKIMNKTLTFSFDRLCYGTAKSVNGIYVLDLTPEVYHVENKKLKSGDPGLSYLWHCRLGHINEKRIKRLISTGVLDSFDFESYGICESCLIGKMSRVPFTGKGTRAMIYWH